MINLEAAWLMIRGWSLSGCMWFKPKYGWMLFVDAVRAEAKEDEDEEVSEV